MSDHQTRKNYHIDYYIFILILILIYLTNFYSYLLFHNLAELFSIVIKISIFAILYNSREHIDNSFFLVVGLSFIFIGFIDLIHTLAYTDMNIFSGYDTNLPAQLWIAARYLQSISLLIASLVLKKKINEKYYLIGFSLYTALIVTLIFLGLFPVCYIEGFPLGRLTPFKVISEYIIDAILAITIVIMYRNRLMFNKNIFFLIISSIILTISSELAFTLYTSAVGTPNLVGHIFKIAAFFLLYKAIISIGLKSPIDLLYRQLKLSEEQYRNLVENIPNVIYSTLPDKARATIFISERWKEWTGLSPEDHYNDDNAWLKIIHPDDRDDIKDKFYEAISVKEEYDLEYRVIHRDTDQIFFLRDQGVPIVDNTGEIIRYDGIISNITARKKAEEKLEQFVSTVSHELKNPIAVLILSLNYVTKHRDEITKEQENKLRDGIMRNVNLLNELVNDLLTLSRIDENKMILDWRKYSPIKIINDNLNLMEPNLKSKNISVDLDIDEDIILYGDIARINQIFRILIDNAWKYSKVRSTITIKAIDHYLGRYNSEGIDGTLFEFIDSGIGINSKDMPFIFDRFFRSSTVHHIPGTGLGLTIAKELIELHQGKIFVESEYRKGTNFLVFLPKFQSK